MIELAITIIAVFFLLCVFSALLGVVVGLLQLLCEFLAFILEVFADAVVFVGRCIGDALYDLGWGAISVCRSLQR